MRKLITLTILFVTLLTFTFVTPAWAGDVGNGAKVFTANCASCHMGGKNVVNTAKTLQKSDLEKYDMYDLVAIKNQVMNGKNAMPSFSGRLTAEQIDDVATYVISQADSGW